MELHSNPRAPDPDTWTGSLAGWDVPRFTDSALCAEIGDDDLWFPEVGGSYQTAINVCERCPVLAECREWSIVHAEKWGIWGGLTPGQRKAARKRRGLPPPVPYKPHRSPCGTSGGYASHRRRGERTCEPCREAQRVAHRTARDRRSAS
jgi:WhiB family redox-sensing transcriptional regulator